MTSNPSAPSKMAAPNIPSNPSKSINYAMVSNIPNKFHSSDLRNYFSQLVEIGGFSCFHYRHRPAAITVAAVKTFCCIVKVNSDQFDKLMQMYHHKHWVNSSGDSSSMRCHITKIKITGFNKDIDPVYKTRLEQRTIPRDRVQFTADDLSSLIEMHPPALMPNGNVGTPTSHFLNLINTCRMPAGVIRKLGLVFPKRRGRGIYGSVPYDYGSTVETRIIIDDDDDGDVRTSLGHRIRDRQLLPSLHLPVEVEQRENEQKSEEDDDDDDDDGEEWDRHEALHDNVTEQERAKERLYEEEIELKWEKGGSGLVFYTDAQYWDELQGDFDEKTSDDWDVDYSIYYDEDGGDKDARDYVQMRYEGRLHDGHTNESAFNQKIGRFERHTKGIGRRLMERDGWKDGQGLGRSADGIADALENDGQHPRNKRGLGYHGEKLVRFPIKKPTTEVRISTIYDDPSCIDQEEPLLRRGLQSALKHRPSPCLKLRRPRPEINY